VGKNECLFLQSIEFESFTIIHGNSIGHDAKNLNILRFSNIFYEK